MLYWYIVIDTASTACIGNLVITCLSYSYCKIPCVVPKVSLYKQFNIVSLSKLESNLHFIISCVYHYKMKVALNHNWHFYHNCRNWLNFIVNTQISWVYEFLVSCISSIADHEFCHNNVKTAVDPWGNSRVYPQITLKKLLVNLLNNI